MVGEGKIVKNSLGENCYLLAVCCIQLPENDSHFMISLKVSVRNFANKYKGEQLKIMFCYNGKEISEESLAKKSHAFTEFFGVTTIVRQSTPFNLSIARNVALWEDSSSWIVYVDDDIIFDAGFLEATLDILKITDGSDTPIVGGKILLKSEVPLNTVQRLYLSELNLGKRSHKLSTEFVNGANFCLNAEWGRKIGGFNPSLGRQDGSLLSGEESELILLARKEGKGVFYNADAIVTQIIGQTRTSRSWLAKRAAWEAVTKISLSSGKDEVVAPSSFIEPEFDVISDIEQDFLHLLLFGKVRPTSILISKKRWNFLKEFRGVIKQVIVWIRG